MPEAAHQKHRLGLETLADLRKKREQVNEITAALERMIAGSDYTWPSDSEFDQTGAPQHHPAQEPLPDQ